MLRADVVVAPETDRMTVDTNTNWTGIRPHQHRYRTGLRPIGYQFYVESTLVAEQLSFIFLSINIAFITIIDIIK